MHVQRGIGNIGFRRSSKCGDRVDKNFMDHSYILYGSQRKEKAAVMYFTSHMDTRAYTRIAYFTLFIFPIKYTHKASSF